MTSKPTKLPFKAVPLQTLPLVREFAAGVFAAQLNKFATASEFITVREAAANA